MPVKQASVGRERRDRAKLHAQAASSRTLVLTAIYKRRHKRIQETSARAGSRALFGAKKPAAYSASMPAAFTMRPHFCDSPTWNFASSSGVVVNTSVPLGS